MCEIICEDGAAWLTDAHFAAIGERLGADITALDLHRALGVTDAVLDSLLHHFGSLRSFTASNSLTCEALSKFLAEKRLCKVNFSRHESLTDDVVVHLARGSGAALTALDVALSRVTDEALLAVAEACPNLQRVNFSWMARVA